MTDAPYKPYKGNLYRTIYSLMRLKGDTTRQYLAEMTGLPPTSLNRSLDKMMQLGWIEESGLAESSGGRRPNLYCLSNGKKYFICIALESDSVGLSIFDQSLKVVNSRQLPALPEISAELVLADDNSDSSSKPDTDDSNEIAPGSNLASEDDSGFDLERLEIWWDSLLENRDELLSQNKISIDQVAGNVLLTTDGSGHFPLEESNVFDWLCKKLADENISFARISSIESRLYSALWQFSESLDQTMLAVFADNEAIHIGIAQNGLRHCGGLTCFNAGTLLTSQTAGDTIGHLERQISQTGMLKRFCKIKADKNLTWQDFVSAAGQGKRKALQVVAENAAILSEIVFNALQICLADCWILTGSLTDDLPELDEQASKLVALHAEKAGLTVFRYDNKRMDKNDPVKYGAAAHLIETLLAEME